MTRIDGMRGSITAAIATVALLAPIGAAADDAGMACQASSGLVRLAELPEASGVAISRTTAGRLWVHNDSGAPVLYAVDAAGKVSAKVTVSNARVEDWEAITSGPCASASCLYIGDIGDNDAKRTHVTVYRMAEPKGAGSVPAEAFHATYPDGAHDAESLLVAPDGSLLIVTKGDTGPVAVYRFPRELKSGAPMRLERVGQLSARPTAKQRVTDAAISSDGQWIALRTNDALTFYRAPEFLRGEFREDARQDLTAFGEPQGEGVAFGTGDVVHLAGEGGGKKAAGTLRTLSCRP
jgi:glucose/arabinose dehydrogenase